MLSSYLRHVPYGRMFRDSLDLNGSLHKCNSNLNYTHCKCPLPFTWDAFFSLCILFHSGIYLEKPAEDESLEPPSICCKLPLTTITVMLEAVSWTAVITMETGIFKVSRYSSTGMFFCTATLFCQGQLKTNEWMVSDSIQPCCLILINSTLLVGLRILQWQRIQKWPWKATICK